MKQFYFLIRLSYLLDPFSSFAQKKYNVIFISVDDLSIAFDAYGNPDVPMPNFARLMEHGTLFKQVYCQFPLCSPSRTSLESGQRPDSTGVYDNIISIRQRLGNEYRFLPEYFHDYGYRTENFGKVGPCEHEEEISWDYVQLNSTPTPLVSQDIPQWWIDTLPKTVSSETKVGVFITDLINK